MLGKILKTLLALVAGVAMLIVAGLLFINTDPGRDWVAGYISLYTGQTVQIEGAVSLDAAPLGVRVERVAVAQPDTGEWLDIEEIAVRAPEGVWPPGSGNPLAVLVSGVNLSVDDLPTDLGGTREDPTPLVLPPFPVSLQLEEFRADAGEGEIPRFSIKQARLDFEPSGRVRADLDGSLAGRPLFSRVTVTIGADPENPGGASVDGLVDYFGLTVAATGRIHDYRNVRGVDLKLTAGGDLGSRVAVASPFTREYVEGRLKGDLGSLVFDLQSLEATTANGAINATALVRQAPAGVLVEKGRVAVSAADLGAFLADFDINTAVSGPLEMDAEVRGDREGVDIDHLDIRLGDIATLKASGQLSRIRGSDTPIRIDRGQVALEADSIQALVEALGAESVMTGKLSVRAGLSGAPPSLTLDEIEASLDGEALRASGGGSIDVTEGGTQAEIAVSAIAANLSGVVPAMPLPEWFGGTGRATGTLRFADGVFSVTDLDATFDSARGSAAVNGEIESIKGLVAPRLRVTIESAQTDPGEDQPLVQQAAFDVALPQGLDARATINGQGIVRLGSVEFDGSIESPRLGSGISGSFEFVPNIEVDAPSGVQDAGDVVLEGELSIREFEKRDFTLFATMRNNTGSISYQGRLANDGSGTGTLKLDGMNPNVIAAISGARTAFPHDIHLTASVIHDRDGFMLSDTSLFTGASELGGSVDVRYPEAEDAPVKLRMDVGSSQLYLADLGMDGEASDDAHYFSDDPLNLEFLDRVDLDVTLDVEWLHSRALEYRDVRLSGQSRSGQLGVSSSQQLLGGGTSSMELDVDVTSGSPEVSLDVSMEAIDPGELRAIKEGEDEYRGDVDLELDIDGRGGSVREILSNADGHFLLRINHAVIPNRQLNLLSADFLFEALRVVNPFIRQTSEMELECGLIAFKVQGGNAVADQTLIIKGRRLLIVGEGEIDLGTEKISMVIKPKAQEGIGLNTSGLVKFIGIGGTLAKPEIRTDAKGLLMTGASLGAAVASGGMSLFLQNMFDRVTTGKRECARTEARFRDKLNNNQEKAGDTDSPVPQGR